MSEEPREVLMGLVETLEAQKSPISPDYDDYEYLIGVNEGLQVAQEEIIKIVVRSLP